MSLDPSFSYEDVPVYRQRANSAFDRNEASKHASPRLSVMSLDSRTNFTVSSFHVQTWDEEISQLTRLKMAFQYLAFAYGYALFYLIPYMIYNIGIHLPMQFMDINNESMLIYYTAYFTIGNIFVYSTTWTVYVHVFGTQDLRWSLFRRFSIVLIAHSLCFMARMVYRIKIMTPIYYAIYLGHYFFVARFFQRSIGGETPFNNSMELKEVIRNRRHYLAVDGTPMALIKAFYVFVAIFLVAVFIVVPFIQDYHDVWIRVIFRLIVIPILFAASEYFQSRQIMMKSEILAPYRFLQQKTLSIIHIAILRFLIVSAESRQEIVITTFFSALAEIVFRLSFFRRYYFGRIITLRAVSAFESLRSCCCSFFISNRTPSESNDLTSLELYTITTSNHSQLDAADRIQEIIDPHASASSRPPSISLSSVTSASALRTADGLKTDDRFRITRESPLSMDGYRTWLEESREASIVVKYRTHKEHQDMVHELQMTIALSVMLYMFYPGRAYTSFETFSGFVEMCVNLGIQLVGECVCDFVCVYFSGREYYAERSRSRKQILYYALHHLGIIGAAIQVALGIFLYYPEEFPED
eukprot:TRINITY_DN12840_c0_g2_i2.p1 TRINITY_DN12840_c0_g2~~TRINITY_DN12840_c0_g2_i2.p1  ORF type:complete len:583 (+),score=104.85 TRINITY_DN12840_c0_g2_i2:80-1828(+)